MYTKHLLVYNTIKIKLCFRLPPSAFSLQLSLLQHNMRYLRYKYEILLQFYSTLQNVCLQPNMTQLLCSSMNMSTLANNNVNYPPSRMQYFPIHSYIIQRLNHSHHSVYNNIRFRRYSIQMLPPFNIISCLVLPLKKL